MTFLNENKQCKTRSEFISYLDSLPKQSWSIGATYHNTYIPDESQWRGHASMLSMQKSYEQKTPPWNRGPHLYVALYSPDPNDDGIWIMSPPNVSGIHAGVCNGNSDTGTKGRWGVELVGNFQSKVPSDDQLFLLSFAIAALHVYGNIKVANVNAHRDCMPARTCPGDAFYNIKQKVIDLVQEYINTSIVIPDDEIWKLWGTDYPLAQSARGFGIPQTWYRNMTSPSQHLGDARSDPVYNRNNVIQLFENGMIIYRDGSTRIIMYPEFRVP